MVPHPAPSKPWQFITADLFRVPRETEIIFSMITDFSNFFDVYKLDTQDSRVKRQEVITGPT